MGGTPYLKTKIHFILHLYLPKIREEGYKDYPLALNQCASTHSKGTKFRSSAQHENHRTYNGTCRIIPQTSIPQRIDDRVYLTYHLTSPNGMVIVERYHQYIFVPSCNTVPMNHFCFILQKKCQVLNIGSLKVSAG